MKIEEDIFGNEFVGRSQVMSLVIKYESLPSGAQDLLEAVLDSQVQVSLSKIFAEALAQVSDQFWSDKLELLTPLEWKVLKAMKDPVFRRDLEKLIDEKNLV